MSDFTQSNNVTGGHAAGASSRKSRGTIRADGLQPRVSIKHASSENNSQKNSELFSIRGLARAATVFIPIIQRDVDFDFWMCHGLHNIFAPV